MCEENIVMTLLKRLRALYEYLMIALTTMPMKELIMRYMMTRFIHEMSKCKEKEPQGKNMAMVSCQSKPCDQPSQQGVKTCFYCGTPVYIAQFCYKAKKTRRGIEPKM